MTLGWLKGLSVKLSRLGGKARSSVPPLWVLSGFRNRELCIKVGREIVMEMGHRESVVVLGYLL